MGLTRLGRFTLTLAVLALLGYWVYTHPEILERLRTPRVPAPTPQAAPFPAPAPPGPQGTTAHPPQPLRRGIPDPAGRRLHPAPRQTGVAHRGRRSLHRPGQAVRPAGPLRRVLRATTGSPGARPPRPGGRGELLRG